MDQVTLDCAPILNFLGKREIDELQQNVTRCHEMLHHGTGAGKEYLGWVGYPKNYDEIEFDRVKAAAERIRNQSEVFVVIGIGGSYLGSKAAISMLGHSFYNELPIGRRKGPKIHFAGHNISSAYLQDLLETIEGQDISINIISKSGTTTEPAIAFRVFEEYMENKYGIDGASKRIFVTTDKSKGAMKELADKKGYETFIIPDDIGGRYSVLTPVGLLPMAVAGIDIDAVMSGACSAAMDLSADSMKQNDAYRYAAIRNLLYSKGKTTEIMVSFEPKLFYLGEWYKQLFGESEGKDGKGIFPAYLGFSTDLHSMGQYIQDGRRDIFETVLKVENSRGEIVIEETEKNMDGLNYISGKSLDFVNLKALEGSITAHGEGGVPVMVIGIPEVSPYYFGYLAYFFMKACGMSGYLLGVNPFDQPGVEAYKRNMFALLGKPGY